MEMTALETGNIYGKIMGETTVDKQKS